jgi:hypothetical protein
MRKRLNTDELEEYLQDVADSHRLYPSSHIWTNIQESLHGRSRWPALTFVALFIITALVVGTIFIKPDQNILKALAAQPISNSTAVQQKENLAEHINPVNITSRTIRSIAAPTVQTNNVVTDKLVYEETATVKANSLAVNTTNNKIQTIIPEELPLVIAVVPTQAFTINSNDANKIIVTEEKANAEDLTQKATSELITNFATPPVKIATTKTKSSRWEMDYYITPSSSFRRLIDENATPVTYTPAIPLEANYALDLNKVVRQKAAMGIEIGVGIGYRAANGIIIKTGLQFNVREYDINAFATGYENAQIALNNGAAIDTINALTRYRNNNGSTPITLKNIYHEFSIPVGVEVRRNISKSLTWGVTASVQPTYVFNKQPFIITSNYKNYTEGTALLRNWNVNTSFGAYIGYKAGNVQWHLGPQFRYQQLPSFSNSYRIREYLFDYGVKLGFTKTIK